MRKNLTRILLAVLSLVAALPIHAQVSASSAAPQGINYQSVARNTAGQILTNQPIGLQISVHDSTAGGAIVYQEHHTVVTNAFGTFSVVIGGGNIVLGSFGGIQWGSADKYVQVEMDFTGGTNYTNMGTSKLLSVPFALYAGTSAADIKNVKFDTTGILNIKTAGNTFPVNKPVWLAGGNSGLSTTNNWLGTIDSRDVIIKRGGVEGVRFTAGGAFLATGNNTGVTPASGPGKRMEWIPAKGAFRAGTVTGTAWDDANIGSGSIAMGTDALASGANSLAIGTNVSAIASNTVAVGNNVIAKNPNSMVIGAYNDTSAAAVDSIAASDILFQVGNGSSSARGNALTVSKTGKVVAADLVTRAVTLSDTIINVTGNFTIPINYSLVIIQSTANMSTAQVTFPYGTRIGQMIIIESSTNNANGKGARIMDNATTNHSNVAGSQVDLDSGDTIIMMWDGNVWVELSGSHNH